MQITQRIIPWLLCLLSMTATAQTSDPDEELAADSLEVEISERMAQYFTDLQDLSIVGNFMIQVTEGMPVSSQYAQLVKDKVNLLQDYLLSIDVRWNTFVSTMQADIADSDFLMDIMAKFEIKKAAISDSIEQKKLQCDALSDFAAAEEFIFPQDTTYYRLYKQAFALSLFKKTAPRLELLKSKELSLFEKIQTHYDKAKAATEVLPVLNENMEAMEGKYAQLKATSEEIQQMAYKPFIQRIKDYLIGLACVAILMLFFQLAVSKYKAAKAARMQMKKYEEMMNAQGMGGEYPTI